MRHVDNKALGETAVRRRKALKLSQAAVAEKTGINRSILSRLESGEYSPSADQLLALSEALGFELREVIAEDAPERKPLPRMRIAVAGTGYVGLSLAALLSQRHQVTAVDINEERVERINRWESPIQDAYLEKYLAEHGERGLDLRICSPGTEIMALKNGTVTLPRRKGYSLSVFAASDRCTGVTLRGTKYELENAELSLDFPLGVSNEWREDEAAISAEEGILLIVQSQM